MTGKETESPKAIDLQAAWCENLLWFGIQTVLLNDFAELQNILNSVARKSRGRTVYVTGSHNEKGTIASTIAREIGESLAREKGFMLVDGQSEGIGWQAVTGFVETGIYDKQNIYKRLKIFANPYAANPAFEFDDNLVPVLKSWRAPLFRATQTVVVFDGGRGTSAEVQVAKEAGCRIVPIPGADRVLQIRYFLKR